MTLHRLFIGIGIMALVLAIGIGWLWEMAYKPQSRAKLIVAQLTGDGTSTQGWLLQHHLVPLGFTYSHSDAELCTRRDAAELVARDAADAMSELPHEVLPIVVDALRDPHMNVRLTAAVVCGRFREEAAIEPLVACLHDPESDVRSRLRLECVRSLVEIGPASTPQLIQLLGDRDYHVAGAAADGLGELKDERATDALVLHFGDRSAKALCEIADPKAAQPMQKMLKDEYPGHWQGVLAACVLASLGRPEGLLFLRTALNSGDERDRSYAVEALGVAAPPGAAKMVRSLLKDKDQCVRGCAVRALLELGDPAVTAAKKKIMDDFYATRRDADKYCAISSLPFDDPDLIIRQLAAESQPASRPAGAH